MSRFITRVELKGSPSGSDYDRLHQAMEAKGFTRTIDGNDGKRYHLPPAEYRYEGKEDYSAEQIRAHAETAVLSVWRSYEILTSKITEAAWSGLSQVNNLYGAYR